MPVPLHGDSFPRKPLRSLAGRPLLQRMVDIAAGAIGRRDHIVILTNDDEVALLAERLGCSVIIAPEVADRGNGCLSARINAVVQETETRLGAPFDAVMILRPDSPLIKASDLSRAFDTLFTGDYDSLVSACAAGRPTWIGVERRERPEPRTDTLDEREPSSLYRATGAFLLSRRSVITSSHLASDNLGLAVIPQEHAIDIHSPHEWWICERILQRKRVVFVVIGYAAVGLGHVYRSSLLAHELVDHEVLFVCTRESGLAAAQLAAQSFQVRLQDKEELAELVLQCSPDLVVNDMLNTERDYVLRLKENGAQVLNFEDLGPGADWADLVINDVFLETDAAPNRLNGPDYFCMRDEFFQAPPRSFSDSVQEILVTFGGTDAMDITGRIARLILPVTSSRGIHVTLVTGPGYVHTARLNSFVADLSSCPIELANGTKRMSEYMSRADLAFSSAGRTVFELAAMRVPAIILASNSREETHTFAAEENGFLYLGRNDTASDNDIRAALLKLLDFPRVRETLRDRMSHWDFREGRARVLQAITSLLKQVKR